MVTIKRNIHAQIQAQIPRRCLQYHIQPHREQEDDGVWAYLPLWWCDAKIRPLPGNIINVNTINIINANIINVKYISGSN